MIAQSISKQVKSSGRACGVFRLAKMFLEHVDRLRIRVTALDEGAVLYQIGDGVVSFDSAAVERGAFLPVERHYRFYDAARTGRATGGQ